MKKLTNNKKVAHIVLKIFGLCFSIGADSRRTNVPFSAVLAQSPRRRAAATAISLLVLLGVPAVSPAATVTADVYVRSLDFATTGNPTGHFPGLITAGSLANNPNTSLNQEIRVERSMSIPDPNTAVVHTSLDARVAVNGGQLKANASGFWASSYQEFGGDPSQAATAWIQVRDSFIVAGPGAPLDLSFQVALHGGIQASGANASWHMGAWLAQGFVGLNPNNPFDYEKSIWLAGTGSPGFFGSGAGGQLDYNEGASGDLNGGVYSSETFDAGSPPPTFDREVPIVLWWSLRTDIDDSKSPLGTPGSASGNFYNTATWLGITARDSEGNLVEGLESIGASNYNWLAGEPSPVPVPAAVWLFGSGLLGLIGLARRKRKG